MPVDRFALLFHHKMPLLCGSDREFLCEALHC